MQYDRVSTVVSLIDNHIYMEIRVLDLFIGSINSTLKKHVSRAAEPVRTSLPEKRDFKDRLTLEILKPQGKLKLVKLTDICQIIYVLHVFIEQTSLE